MVAVTVDKGEGLAALVVDILSNVEGTLVAFGAEGAPITVDFVRAGASGAVAGMASESFHYVEFVIARET